MMGRITNIAKDITTILTDENEIIEMNSLFLPVKFKSGDSVELEGNKIVLR